MIHHRSALIVDDEPAVRNLVAALLTRAGFHADVVQTGDEAIKRFEERVYDVAIIDLIMPGKEGIETMIEIRRRWPGSKVIMMSGGGRIGPREILDLAAALGAHATVSKPFTSADLLGMVESVLVDHHRAA